MDAKSVASYVSRAKEESFVTHLMGIIPTSYFDSLAKGDLLQVLLVAILSGFAISHMGKPGEKIAEGVDLAGKMFFRIIGMIVQLAPIGAFGAMAFTIGSFGLGALVNLGYLIFTFYLASLLFVLLVLGGIARAFGFSILRFIGYIKDELLIVLGTSSSETVLPRMITKMEALGASKPVVGLVIPTGYSFNLDGTNIYMTLATLFLAQATNTHLTFGQMAAGARRGDADIEGASGVTGAGFVTLAATLSIIPDIPITALAIIVGIDRVHERMPRAHQSDRQRRRHHRHQPLGRRTRSPSAPRGAAASDRFRRRDGAPAAGRENCRRNRPPDHPV